MYILFSSFCHDKAGYLWSHARIPAGIVAAPEFQMSGGHQWIQNMVLIVYIKGVTEVLRLAGGRKRKRIALSEKYCSRSHCSGTCEKWLTC